MLHAPPQFQAPLTPCNLPVSRCTTTRESAAQRILIMRLGAYGDILMGTPLLAALRAAYPNAYLTWIAGPTEFQAIDASPYLDELIVWDGAYIRSAWRHGRIGPAVVRSFSLWRELRRRQYDVFVSLQPEEWPLLIKASGAAQTIGIFNTFARHWGEERNPHYQKLYTQAYSRPEQHRIDQYLAVLEAFGLPKPTNPRLTMGYTAGDRTAADTFLETQGISGSDAFVVLAPSTTWPTKCWPADRYAALGDALAKEHGCRIVLIGTADEGKALAQIASAMSVPVVVAAGALTFREAAALIARSCLLVSGDTGPMHVAAALGTPQVALFGATSPAWYGPRTPSAISLLHEVPCGPCDQKECNQVDADYLCCLKLISVEEARAAARQFLGVMQ